MKVRTNKPKRKPGDNPSSWNTPMERMRTNAMVGEEQHVLSHWNMDSDITVERMSTQAIEAKAQNVDIPSIYSTLLDDFSGEVLDEETGKVFCYHYRKSVFNPRRVSRLRAIGRFGIKRFTPVAEIMIECEGRRIGTVFCDLPDSPNGDRTAYIPSTFGVNEEMERFSDIAITAMLVVQNEMLHRPRDVKKNDSKGEPLEIAPTTKKPQRKSGTIISLRKNYVRIETNRRFRWTEFWIVGCHIRTYRTTDADGNETVTQKRIEPYLKGPERNSEEAKKFLEQYLKDEAVGKIKIVL